jgi:cell wall-associated NlpC family hydrolase
VYGWRAARGSRGRERDSYVPVFTKDAAGTAVRFAYQQLGKSYRFASEGPDTYDCSGLTMASWRAAGTRLPHNAAMQWRTVRHVDRPDLRPGDLVFYYRDIHHVAMYVGDGRIIEAPEVGEVVSIRPIDFAPIRGYGRP